MYQDYREIVSNVIETWCGYEAWVEMDAAGHLTVRCTAGDLYEYRAGLAPALYLLGRHRDECEGEA